MGVTRELVSHLDTRLLDLKKIKDRGTKIVGYTPNAYMPEELVYGSGAVSRSSFRQNHRLPAP